MLRAISKLSQGEKDKAALTTNTIVADVKEEDCLEAKKVITPLKPHRYFTDWKPAEIEADPYLVVATENEKKMKTAKDIPDDIPDEKTHRGTASAEPCRESMDVDEEKVNPKQSTAEEGNARQGTASEKILQKGTTLPAKRKAPEPEETVSEAASDTDTVSEGAEVLSGVNTDTEDEGEVFETRLNRSAVKYNRLPVSPAFAKSLDLDKNKGKEWQVKDHEGKFWPISFHQEGGFEMIKGWRPVVADLELGVGSVLMLFRPDADENSIEVRKVDQGLKKEATGQKIGDVTLGEIIPDETISSTSGDISAVRHIEYRGKKHMAFLKKVAIGAVRSYGTNPPRLELHHKAGSILLFLKKAMEAGNFHVDCQLRYNDNGDHHIVKVTIRNYIVLRWGNPSYKRFYSLQEGDTIMCSKIEDGLIDVRTEPGVSDFVQKTRAKRGEGGPKRNKKKQKIESPAKGESRSPSRSGIKNRNSNNNFRGTTISKLAKDMIEGGKLSGGQHLARTIDGSSYLAGRAFQHEHLSNGRPASNHSALDEYQDIEALLRGQGLYSYVSLFRKEAVTLKTLRTGLVTEEHLKELGLPIGPRLEILSLLKEE